MIDIDILPASTQSKGGDSVLIRIGNFSYNSWSENKQKVILIDGGYQDNWEVIDQHLRKIYRTDTIDLAIITHPDMDHIAGFQKILENNSIKVLNTAIHDPWQHTRRILTKVDGRRTANSLKSKFEATMKKLSAVLDLVERKNTEPFAGDIDLSRFGLTILGPKKEYYQNLLLQFPEMDQEHTRKTINWEIYSPYHHDYAPSFPHFLKSPITSAKNESSTITILHSQNSPIALFTGDAGVEAIEAALDYADVNAIPYKNVELFQIPHHGSIKNINKHLIDRISPKNTYVSAPPESDDHPSKLVLNYLTHIKNIPVYHVKDKGGLLWRFDSSPARPDWSITAAPASLFDRVKKLMD